MMANDRYRKTISQLACLRCDWTSNPPQVLVLSNDESKAEEISIPYGAYSPVGKQSWNRQPHYNYGTAAVLGAMKSAYREEREEDPCPNSSVLPTHCDVGNATFRNEFYSLITAFLSQSSSKCKDLWEGLLMKLLTFPFWDFNRSYSI